jgi:hypothetical protein
MPPRATRVRTNQRLIEHLLRHCRGWNSYDD